MKIQIRRGVFETNSSSTHSLSIFKKDDWAKFENGQMVIYGFPYESELVDINTVDPKKIYNGEDDADAYCFDYFTYNGFNVYMEDYYCDDIVKEVDDLRIMSVYKPDC